MEIIQYPKPRSPWLCSGCDWYIFTPKMDGCPLCRDNPKFDLSMPKREFRRPLCKRAGETDYIPKKLLLVAGIGQNSQKKSLPTKNPAATRFVCISDTHGRHRLLDIAEGDVLIHSGDITMCGKPEILEDFNKFLGELPHPYKIPF